MDALASFRLPVFLICALCVCLCVCVAADVSVGGPPRNLPGRSNHIVVTCPLPDSHPRPLSCLLLPVCISLPSSPLSPRPSLATSPTLLLPPFLRGSSLKLLRRRFAVHRVKADKTLVVRLSLLSPHRSRSLELTFLSNCSAFCLPPRTLQFSSAYSAITTFSL